MYYASPAQVNILTPPDAMSGPVQVEVTSNGASAGYTQQAAAVSVSFFVFNGGPYVAATHADGSLLGPASLYPGATTPAQPGETLVLYAKRIRADVESRDQRVGGAIGSAVAGAGGDDRRRDGDDGVRGGWWRRASSNSTSWCQAGWGMGTRRSRRRTTGRRRRLER